MNSQSMLFCNLCPTVANLHSGATVNRTEKEKHSHIDWIPTGIKESKMWVWKLYPCTLIIWYQTKRKKKIEIVPDYE